VTVVEAADVSSLAKVAEITRKLYHQGNAEGVLKTAANEIGAQWRSSRCIAALRKPGLPPSSVQEYHAEGLMPVSAAALATLVEALQDLAVARGTVTISDAANAPELLSVKAAIEESQIKSLMALPLAEGEDQIGVLILTQNASRTWQESEVLVIRTLTDQMVIALNNVGLRRLVKNLSVTDEKSGLLKRASYLDLLQAETRRGLQQGTAVTVLLMQFGKRSPLVKEFGEAAVRQVMDQNRATVFGEHPLERSGISLRSDHCSSRARRHRRKRSTDGDREIAAAAEGSKASRERAGRLNSAPRWRRL